MASQDMEVIDGLFDRLKQAEEQTGPRDSEAADHIGTRLKAQPYAPYYMAQSMIIQEAALKKLHAQVTDLQQQLAAAQAQPAAAPQNRGGFLASLFGGGQETPPAPTRASAPPPYYTSQPAAAAPPPTAARGSGFLGGALQTAAGVAGGIVVADMLTGMFHHSQPEEIVDVINQPPEQPMDSSFGDDRYYGNDGGWNNDPNAGYNDSGYDPGDAGGGWGDNDDNYF